MKILLLTLFVVVVVNYTFAAKCFPRKAYPAARRDESVVDDYFGVKVTDPYRWLENSDSPETKKFVLDQNKISRPYFDSSPAKTEIKERLTQVWNYPKYSTPVKAGNKYFYLKNNGLQNQDILYVQENLDGEPKLFLDPSTLSKDGSTAISSYKLSDDGSTLAYGLSRKGSDWITISFKDVETGKNYPEILEYVKFSKMAWTKDGKGFFYSRYPIEADSPVGFENQKVSDQKLYYHRLGTPQLQDVLVFEYPQQPLWKILGVVSDDGKYLIVYVAQDAFFNLVYYADLSAVNYEITSNLQFVPLISTLNAEYRFVTNDGPLFIFRTNKNAPNFKLITIDLEHPEEAYWKDLVPEQEKDVLEAAYAVDEDKLVLHYIRDVKSILQLHSLKTGELLKIFDLDVGSIGKFYGKKSQSEIFYKFSSFFTPEIIYYVDLKKQPYEPVVFRKAEVKGFNPALYEAKQVIYSSKDGTKIPMFMISKRGLVQDGSNPVLLTGYGGFGFSMLPRFDPLYVAFLQNFNGIIAIPNIRGGGEYGENWHQAGALLNKQNTFDDFQAAAEYLIAEKYTKPSLITIQGKSNGGLVVATTINQRPDLFGAAIIRLGVLDMLRYQKFNVGYSWASDYGTSENETQFFNLLRYSPLHNIRTPPDHRYEYPATLVLTTDYDDRVVPAHSLKYIATLQNAVQNFRQYRPLLARIDVDSGHGEGRTTNKLIDEYTDILSFISQALGLKLRK